MQDFRASIRSSCSLLDRKPACQPSLGYQVLRDSENSNSPRYRIKAPVEIFPLSSNVLET